MNLSETETYLVQRDWGGVPVSLGKHGDAVAAGSQSGRDLLALFPALREELASLPGDCELSGLLYLYHGWTRQPLSIAREVVLGKRSLEGLLARIDVLEGRGDGDAEERWRAVEALLSRHAGVILRPALTDVLPGGECALLARTGGMHLLARSLESGATVRLAGADSDVLRCGAWERRELGDGLVELGLLDAEGNRYTTTRGFSPGGTTDAGAGARIDGPAVGSLRDWRPPGQPERWRAEETDYRIEREDETHAQA